MMAIRLTRRTVVLAALAVLIAVPASASVLTPSDVLTSSYWTGRAPVLMIDGSLLNEVGDVLDWTHTAVGGADGCWHAGPNDGGLGGPVGNPPVVDDQKIVFTLPVAANLTGAYFWNQPQVLRGVNEFEILTSTDEDLLTATFVSQGIFNLAAADGGASLPTQAKYFAANGVKFVAIDINSAHSGTANNYVGLAEVRFAGEYVPEPSSLMLLGCALVLGAVRHRRRA